MNNDERNKRNLIEAGWTVFVVWECELGKNFDKTMENLAEKIRNS